MTILLTVLGIVVFAVGLLISIAWHELGHLSTAKLFGIRVPQYMVGFGPTLWSRQKGDTEYGIKAIPMGGYIRMIGMFPPGEDGKLEARSTSPWRGMIEDARSAAFEELQPGDEKRLFYTRKPWKRVIVMFAGPFMNLVLAVAIFLGVAMTFGFATQTTEVAGVSEMRDRPEREPRHLRQERPGLARQGRRTARRATRSSRSTAEPVDDWATLSSHIRETIGPATITVERDGQQQVLNADARQEQGGQEGRRRRGRPRRVRRRPATSASPPRPRSCRCPSATRSTAWAT